MAARRPNPKRIVYLWGAGATHAEAQRLGSTVNLLMRSCDDFGEGVASRIIHGMASKLSSPFDFGEVADIEKLISLLAASGTHEHLALANRMREGYFHELRTSLAESKVLDNPWLATKLLRMHSDSTFSARVETLQGIITTNHDGLLQVASQQVFEKINIGFKFASNDFLDGDSEVAPILQLHGSFTWRFGAPIRVSRLRTTSRYHPETVWLPPTILKESKNYPFNKLLGLAYELLLGHCDVLRVVGTSLSQNDWNILCLVFNAQRHREAMKKAVFRIELIMPKDAGEYVQEECGYLRNMTPIGHLTDGDFTAFLDPEADFSSKSDLSNPLAYWLDRKIAHHRARAELEYLNAEDAAA